MSLDKASMVSFGFEDVPIDRKQSLVDGVFRRVASDYDLMNDLMSGGLHRLWKEAAVTILAPPRHAREYRVLDVAGGTGDIAFRIRDICAEAEIVLLDINGDMLSVGQQRARERDGAPFHFIRGNGESLPFGDGFFEACTIAFGIRNIPRIDQALREIFRVLRYGGRFVCLEFSHVDLPLFDRLYDLYSFNMLPMLGQLVAGEREAYLYLAESIRKFPDQEKFASMLCCAGFEQVTYRNFLGGIVAIHSGWRL
ncbi:MAG: bifunctional demethylmenaquinone methyltransferase/2-methoxy-6-polyprenyl-1,4-benzoquinol methylase UbiE [Alphaproteobacteria bacterium]|nr:bifunctional demethylmenaquinone methyltransferase/2-methoxy-6-polyprenyl-1,4-benzoquinol methylase UbiE [Alphaproteobacteria bacterium]